MIFKSHIFFMKKHILILVTILIIALWYTYYTQTKSVSNTEITPALQQYLAGEQITAGTWDISGIWEIPDLANPLDPAPLEERILQNDISHHVTLTIYSRDKLNSAVINIWSPVPEKVITQIKKGIYLGIIKAGDEDSMFGIPDADSDLPIPTVLDPDVYYRINSFEINDEVAAFSVMFGE